MTPSMPHSLDRRQLLRQGAIFIGAGGALSLLDAARAGAQPSPIQLGRPAPKLPLKPNFPTDPPSALPTAVQPVLDGAMRAAIGIA